MNWNFFARQNSACVRPTRRSWLQKPRDLSRTQNELHTSGSRISRREPPLLLVFPAPITFRAIPQSAASASGLKKTLFPPACALR
ncbi:MAG: hypothetical protein V5B40_23040 [Candidatus Accumulibacter meliphilus]|jgi:hypothetical protein|uniref:hypothetical protein n=1 Tax=Candidatus Accumulibacter meliphilus TaxID=2211374 RepID=UPI002FC3D29E